MYARNVSLKLKPNSAPEFVRLIEKEIIPLLRKQKGFQDEISFVSAERNEAMAISFWDKQDDAQFYNHVAYLDVLKVLSRVVETMPIIKTFEVANSTSHRIAARCV
ncbi:MAG TPA: hypothetical protein VFU31_01935 [Candidatus Binatia bacterium]|nr:hypothetical protein [Candidatus Binatia bacterium]